MTLGELRTKMSAAELTAWMGYARIEPIGGVRGDLRAGVVASTIANVNRGKSQQAYKPVDFMPILQAQQKPKQDDPETLAQEIMSAFQRIKKETD